MVQGAHVKQLPMGGGGHSNGPYADSFPISDHFQGGVGMGGGGLGVGVWGQPGWGGGADLNIYGLK